jgi:hypothetical protein
MTSGRLVMPLLASLSVVAQAAPGLPREACLVRAEAPVAVAAGAAASPAASQSRLGWRQKTTRLFEVELTMRQGLATCSIAGTAKLRSDADGDALVLPVRPAGGTAHGAPPCLVTVHVSPAFATVTTSEASCRAQDLCGGRVEVQGQRFESNSGVPPGGGSACFSQPAS